MVTKVKHTCRTNGTCTNVKFTKVKEVTQVNILKQVKKGKNENVITKTKTRYTVQNVKKIQNATNKKQKEKQQM